MDETYLRALVDASRSLAAGLVHYFGWDDWKPEGDRMVSPGGRKLPRATWERLKARGAQNPRERAESDLKKTEAEANARYAREGQGTQRRAVQRKTLELAKRAGQLRDKIKAIDNPPPPAAPLPPKAKSATPDLNTFLKTNKPADVDPAAWRRLMMSAEVRRSARWVVEQERKATPGDEDRIEDHRNAVRSLEWRLQGKKIPKELAPAAVEMARLEVKHRELSGATDADVVIPQPARGRRYAGADEFNGARYAMVNDTPFVKAMRQEQNRLSNNYDNPESLHAKAKRLGNGAYLGTQLDIDPVRRATDGFLSDTKPDRYGNEKWKDKANWTPEALKAAWDDFAKPRLDKARQYLDFAKQDWVVDAKTDPEKLVKAARDSGNYDVQALVGQVLNRVHGIDFRRENGYREDTTTPSWNDILEGKATLADVRKLRTKEAADYTAQRNEYARKSVGSIKQAANLIAKLKSEHWPYLKTQLKKADLGRIEKRAGYRYVNGQRVATDEFVFWPKTGSAITAYTVPALLAKIQVVAATLDERTATEDQLDKVKRSVGER